MYFGIEDAYDIHLLDEFRLLVAISNLRLQSEEVVEQFKMYCYQQQMRFFVSAIHEFLQLRLVLFVLVLELVIAIARGLIELELAF